MIWERMGAWGLCRASKWNHVLGAFLGEGKTKDNGKLAIDSWISVRVVAGRGKCHAHSLLFINDRIYSLDQCTRHASDMDI